MQNFYFEGKRRPMRPVSRDEGTKILYLYLVKQKGIVEIAKDLTTAPERVLWFLRKEKIALRESTILFTPDEEKRVVRLYKKRGFSLAKLCKRFSVPSMSIIEILQKYDLPLQAYKRDIIFLYEKELKSIRAIALQFKISRDYVSKLLKDNNVQIRPAGIICEEDEQEIVRLYVEEQKTAAELAAQFGVSTRAVCDKLNKHQVERHHAGKGRRILRKDTEQEVIHLYVEEKWSCSRLGIKYGVSKATILEVLKRNNIPRRSPGGTSKVDENMQKQILDLHAQNMATGDIAHALNISNTTVLKYLKAAGINMSLGKPKLQLDEEEIICLYQKKGHSIEQISKQLKVSTPTISNVLKKNNVPITRHSLYQQYPKAEVEQQVISLYQQGLSGRDVGDKVGFSADTVFRILRRHEVPIRTYSQTRRAFTEEQEKEIVQLYKDENLSVSNLSAQFGVATATVRKLLRKHKVYDPEKRGKVTAEIAASIVALYTEEQLSSYDIAKQLDLHNTTVLEVLERHNIPRRKRTCPLTAEQQKEAVKLYTEEKLSINIIAQRFNTNGHTIAKILRKNEVKIAHTYRSYKFSKDEQKDIVYLYTGRKLSQLQIAHTFGVTATTISRVLLAHNVEIENSRAKIKFSADDLDEMAFLYTEEQLPSAEIGQLFGVSKQTIIKNLKEQGVPMRPPIHLRGKHNAKLADMIEEDYQKLIPEDKKGIIAAGTKKSGMSNSKIAKDFGVFPATVNRVLQEHRKSLLEQQKEPQPEKTVNEKEPIGSQKRTLDDQTVIDMYTKEFLPMTVIAKEFNCSIISIWDILKSRAIRRRAPRVGGVLAWHKDDVIDIVALYEEVYLNSAQIGAHYMVSTSTITKLLHANNAAIRTPGKARKYSLNEFNEKERQTIISLNLQGRHTIDSLARMFCTTPYWIRMVLRAANTKEAMNQKEPCGSQEDQEDQQEVQKDPNDVPEVALAESQQELKEPKEAKKEPKELEEPKGSEKDVGISVTWIPAVNEIIGEPLETQKGTEENKPKEKLVIRKRKVQKEAMKDTQEQTNTYAQYEIKNFAAHGPHAALWVKYPANGIASDEKVLVFLNTSLLDVLNWKKINPTFRTEGGEGNGDMHEAPSPDAQFPPTDKGRADAARFMDFYTQS